MCRYSSLLILLVFLLPASSHAWWSDAWQFRKDITINTAPITEGMPEDLVDVQVPVRLHAGNFQYFFDINGDGSDIRFIAQDDRTPLKFHIEKFDILNEMAIIWVQLPHLPVGTKNQLIYMYYGNFDAVNAESPASVFDVNQTAVYHFGQKTGGIRDYTVHAHEAVFEGPEPTPNALIGCGMTMTGQGGIKLPESSHLLLGGEDAVTGSLWYQHVTTNGKSVLFSRSDDQRIFAVEIDNDMLSAVLYDATSNSELARSEPAIQVLSESWNHIAFTTGSGFVKLILNGKLVAEKDMQLPSISGNWYIGSNPAGEQALTGIIDEVRFSNIQRSTFYLRKQSLLEAPLSDLILYGEDAQNQNGGIKADYLLHALSSIDVTGWSVIIILFIMGLISMMVFFLKTWVLNSTVKANNAFLGYYRNIDSKALASAVIQQRTWSESDDSDLGSLITDEHERHHGSTHFRVYAAALDEIKIILNETDTREIVFDANTIESIRSAMHITLVRELERLRKRLTVMTIAISGAPFLGLLGTVIGVMITFAVISATGDVNVTSIAPGIAGALSTTVMGLCVAIPNLFAYNYLALKLQAISSDTRAFLDQLSARLARLRQLQVNTEVIQVESDAA